MSNVSTNCVIWHGEKRFLKDEMVQKDSPNLFEHITSIYPGVPEWLVHQSRPWDFRTFSHAALCGHLDVVKWLKYSGYTWNSDTCSKAALGGNIEILKWALENGCPWSNSVCTNAALHGHLDIIKWAFFHKFKSFDGFENVYKTCCNNAAYGGHLDIIVWFYTQGFPMKSALKSEIYYTASFAGQLDVEKWLKSKGVFLYAKNKSNSSSSDSSEEFEQKFEHKFEHKFKRFEPRYKRERYSEKDHHRHYTPGPSRGGVGGNFRISVSEYLDLF